MRTFFFPILYGQVFLFFLKDKQIKEICFDGHCVVFETAGCILTAGRDSELRMNVIIVDNDERKILSFLFSFA
jgi:hypothetical protein